MSAGVEERCPSCGTGWSISRTIGMMAEMLGEPDAAPHLERAAKVNSQIGAVALVAQTEALLAATA
jgi:hypothetical protein